VNGVGVIVYLIIWLAFGFGTMKLATSKGRHAVEGLLLGLLLGLIGLIIELVLPKKNKQFAGQ
jgi:hypothetical protein